MDAMNELHSIHVDPRAYRLFYILNEATRVRVRTGCGYSDWGEVGELLGQGSGGAAKVSALNLSRKLDFVFGGSSELAKYGGVKQHPYSFQDDVCIPVETVDDVRSSNIKMAEVMRLMQTTLNKDKSGYIFIGSKKQVDEARAKVKDSPLICSDFQMKELKEEKWLGDFLAGGLKESVIVTIQKRESKTRRASYEIINIVKDYRAQLVGGFQTGLVLWESCVIPSLLYNSSTWVEVSKDEEKTLEDMQDYFLRLLWGAGPGTPRVSLRADTATRSMATRIYKEKIMLVYHISHLEVGSLARDMMDEQVRHGWPGLTVEVSKLCNMLRLEDARTTVKDRQLYAKEVKKACKWKDEAMMKEAMEGMKYKKMRTMYQDNLDMKEYVKTCDLYTARTTWEVRSHMLRVAGNYPGHNKYAATGWRCQACALEVREDQEHLASCSGYADFSAGKDLSEEQELVTFYKNVMARRKDRGWG